MIYRKNGAGIDSTLGTVSRLGIVRHAGWIPEAENRSRKNIPV